MQIEIDNREVRKILSDTVKLQKTIGFEMMKKLKLRKVKVILKNLQNHPQKCLEEKKRKLKQYVIYGF